MSAPSDSDREAALDRLADAMCRLLARRWQQIEAAPSAAPPPPAEPGTRTPRTAPQI